jgi:hypothetical protein
MPEPNPQRAFPLAVTIKTNSAKDLFRFRPAERAPSVLPCLNDATNSAVREPPPICPLVP